MSKHEGWLNLYSEVGEGAAAFVQKPFTLRAIGTVIKEALAPPARD